MKYTYALCSFLTVFFYAQLSAQYELGASLRFKTQQEIDDFSMTHPGVTEVTGNVWIEESMSGAITNLVGLSQLRKVNEGVYIKSNDELMDLTGLENLSFTRKVYINDNPSLVSLKGLNGLGSISEFYLRDNNSLKDLTGLESLQRVQWYMEISDNPELESLSGVNSLQAIRRLIITNNNKLTNLGGLESVQWVEDYIEIEDNATLSSLEGIDDLFSIASYRIIIKNNPNLSTCGVPSICRYADDGIALILGNNDVGCNSRSEISNNCTLPSYSCLPDGITFTSQQEVDNFRTNYPNCWDIGGTVTITGGVSSIAGLNQVASIDGDLIIQNSSLTSLRQFNIRRINGELRVENNYSLSEINGLAYINRNTISNLVVYNNIQLGGQRCSVFCGYLYGGGPFNIGMNRSGCNSGDEILGWACILLSVDLTLFTANIRNKTAILNWQTASETNNTGFEIQKSKDGVHWEKTGWLAGQGNSAEAQSYTYTDKNPFFGISYYRLKQVDVDGNFEYSDVVSVEYKGKSTISLYPNPAENILHIADLNGQNIRYIRLYNQAGQAIPVNMKTANSINTSQLIPGVYIVKMMINEDVIFEKFLVK